MYSVYHDEMDIDSSVYVLSDGHGSFCNRSGCLNLTCAVIYTGIIAVVSDRVLLLYKQKENTMTHNRDYVFSQDNIQTVGDFVDCLSEIPRYAAVRLITVKDRDGKTGHFEIDASQCTGEKWIVYDLNDCLHLVCSDVYILGMMFDGHYVIFKP